MDYNRKEEHHVKREGPLGTFKEDIKIKGKCSDTCHGEEHHIKREGPLGTYKEDVKVKGGCSDTGCGQSRDVKITQDLPGGTRKVEEHVRTGEQNEGLLSKAARKVGLKD